ncbi:MAG TPA: hypothetical protein VGZ50_00865 [Actinomycetota bacterium]|nr:hypothetical protein [Actinomycetota bacterium]
MSQGRALRVERFRRVLDGAVEATGEAFVANGGWDPGQALKAQPS